MSRKKELLLSGPIICSVRSVVMLFSDYVYFFLHSDKLKQAHSVFYVQAWTIWYNQWTMKRQQKHQERQAKLISEENLTRRCFEAWKSYHVERKRKEALAGACLPCNLGCIL